VVVLHHWVRNLHFLSGRPGRLWPV
jgi:hypothetical protein